MRDIFIVDRLAKQGIEMNRVKTLVLLAGLFLAEGFGHSYASAQEQLSPEARKGVMEALQVEAYASMKYKLFAEHARRAGKKELAELMEVTANQEYGHFLRWAAVYGLVGDEIKNLRDAITGEADGHEAFYSRLAAEANARGDKELVKHYEEIESQEVTHEDAFKKAVDKALTAP